MGYGIMDYVPAGSIYNYAGAVPKGYDVNVALAGTAVPEPTTLILFGAGLGVLGLVRRRRS